jgi:nicotinate-nucleotide--dimethylbenzimidazole phosphoribosyltransferase
MLSNFISGGAAINVLSKHVGADVVLVDVGAVGDIKHPLIINRKVKKGTDNFTRGPAMSREEAVKAVEVGIEVAMEKINEGAGLIAIGDMGIGNTTASSALIAAFTGFPVRSVVGKGTGISESIFERKVEVIEQAIEVNHLRSNDPLDVLAKVGGLEIGALAGVILACAHRGVPVIIDGFISGAAALLAVRMSPNAKHYLFPSHLSEEPGHRIVLEELGLKPFLLLDMRLGEGTGAVLGMFIVEAALKVLNGMATFEEAGVSREVERSQVED